MTWSGPNGFTASGTSIIINNAQLVNAGVYTARVTDAFGCVSTCPVNLVVNPNPSCLITPPAAQASVGQPQVFTITITSGTAPFTVTLSGCLTETFTTSDRVITRTVTCGPTPSTCTLTANITDVNGCTGGPCSATLTCVGTPNIIVYKQVVCVMPDSPATCGAFGPNLATDNKSASGVKGDTTCPAFCYRITVVNNGQVPLQDVVVNDPTISLASCNFPTTLAVGQQAQCVVSGVTLCNDTVNTVTVRGQSVFDTSTNGTVTDTDTARVTVVPISVNCRVILTSSFDMDTVVDNNHVTLPAGQVDAPVTVAVVLNNTSAVDLSVTLSGLPGLVDCATGAPMPPLGAVSVPANSSVTVDVGCTLVSCPDGLNFTVSVVGTAIASTARPCVYTSQGVAVTTAVSTCPASVTCEQPVTCRTTGGGVLMETNVDQNCIQVATTLSPLFSSQGQRLVKVTHGGQLGAPFSHQNCGLTPADLSDLCIRGQWQHVRHYQGQGNPREVVTAIHNANPNVKIGYDSLMCACLGCCPEAGVTNPPVMGGSFKKFDLCNPDDHKICGPMPRPAPANSIIFSGLAKVARVTDTSVRDDEYIVFRVYIEDRSEPGGHWPKGAVQPADVYVFQAWKTGVMVATGKNKKGQDISSLDALRMAVAQDSCDFLNALSAGQLPYGSLPLGSVTVNGVADSADVVDQGPMLDGNHQIHPSTSATCP